MYRLLPLATLVAALGLGGLPGCQHCCRKPAAQPLPAVSNFPPFLHSPTPPPVYQPPPQTPAPDVRLSPPSDPVWRPVPEGGRTGEPPLAPTEQPRQGVRLYPPEPLTPAADVTESRTPTPPLPVGIPQFAMARERVASGLKPLLDGLDWLQANGYRTVLHLRAPGQEDNADRREVEKRGLKYLSLEVSPQTLTRKLVDEFSRLVSDSAAQPLFVYDKDGVVAGGLWYLHFRFADKAGDDLARTKAARLGLREDQTGENKLLWLAIQRLLSEYNG